MPAYNFKEKFAELVELGIKTCTIRKKRKRRTKVGDKLYLYTGQRTKSCRKLGEEVCTGVYDLMITEDGMEFEGHRMSEPAMTYLMSADGFNTIEEMRDFFRKQYGLPFEGVVIQWSDYPKLLCVMDMDMINKWKNWKKTWSEVWKKWEKILDGLE